MPTFSSSDTFIAEQDRVLLIANCQQKIDENAHTLMYRHQSCSALCEQDWQNLRKQKTFFKARKCESSDKKSEKDQVGEDGCEVSNLNGDVI